MFESMFEREKFDVIVHLMGQQKLPTFMGIRQFDCNNHVVVTSAGYADTTNTLSIAVGGECTIREVHVEPYDATNVSQIVLEAVKPFEGKRIGFNLTGGTKLMFVGAFAACEACKGVPFYFETLQNELVWLQGDFKRSRVARVQNVEDFFKLCGFSILDDGKWDKGSVRTDRQELTEMLWANAHQVTSMNRELASYNDYDGLPFSVSRDCLRAELKKSGHASVQLRDKNFTFESFPDLAKYLSGGWFEEFVYLQLRPLLDQGTVTDLRIGMRIDWPAGVREPGMGAQEFDAVLTDGYRLILVECKSGQALTQHYESLQNHVALYGGVTALGILAAVRHPHPSTERKIRESSSVCGFWGKAVEDDLPKRALSVRHGRTYSGRVPGLPKKPKSGGSGYSYPQKGGRR
jgi:hypothetical protein